MCGIAGIAHLDGKPVEQETLDRFCKLLAHRGPDGMGTWREGNVGLAHTRLAILDKSNEAAAQPMRCGPGVLVYNGEVYNFIELLKRTPNLAGPGEPMQTSCDTEVVLRYLIRPQYRPSDALPIFNGMFALALWNDQNQSLFLARDRWGVKPLYIYQTERIFAFASEPKAFLAFTDLEIDPEYLALHWAQPMTDHHGRGWLWKNVRPVLPGHYVTVQDGQVSEHRWWRTLDHLPDVPALYQDQAARLRSLLLDACRMRTRSDVPIGTSLSGGLDSSSVFWTTLQTEGDRLPDRWRRAYVAHFERGDNAEQLTAERLVKETDADLASLRIEARDAILHLERMVYHYEEPAKIYPAQWLLYRAMREDGTVVSLDGHGADETLAGYVKDHGLWPGIGRREKPKTDCPIWAADRLELKHADSLLRRLYWRTHCGHLQWILRMYDRASMAHGAEVRMPFMDWRIVTYALALPSQSKVKSVYGKAILREAMSGIVSDKIRLNPRKVGFNSPMKKWLKGPLKPVMDEITTDHEFKQSGWPADLKGVLTFMLQRSFAERRRQI